MASSGQGGRAEKAEATACLSTIRSVLKDLMRNERRAWMSCPACRRPPENPYSDTRVAELVASVLPSGKALPWSAVEAAWRRATLLKDGVCGSELILVSVVTGADGSPPSVHAAACLNASLGVLWRYKEFKFYLQLALHGLASGGARPPESFAFVLDLTDRGDGGYGGGGPWVRDDGRFTKHVLLAPDGTRLPKLASSGPPGCAANLPVPFGLKGFGAGSWQAILRSPNFGGGSNFHFPRRPPPSELSQQAVWRGALRDYSGPCVNASAEHPRLRVVQMADRQGMRRTEWRGGSGGAMLRLNASFMPCATNEGGPKCSREALKARGLQLGSRVSFEAHVKSVAAIELDGYGYQASLASKLALGVCVISPPSRFPSWIENFLQPNEHLLRPEVAAIPDALRWLAQQPAEAERLASSGQRRACALLHAPHAASYLARLLNAYAAGFEGPYPPALHARVARLASVNLVNKVLAAEALWFRRQRDKKLMASEGMKGSTGATLCDGWWIGELDCSMMIKSRVSVAPEGRDAGTKHKATPKGKGK